MRVYFERGKFLMDPTLDFVELEKNIPLAATIATFDLRENFRELTYKVIDGGLYAVDNSPHIAEREKDWWYYDPSVRTWSKCEYPR